MEMVLLLIAGAIVVRAIWKSQHPSRPRRTVLQEVTDTINADLAYMFESDRRLREQLSRSDSPGQMQDITSIATVEVNGRPR